VTRLRAPLEDVVVIVAAVAALMTSGCTQHQTQVRSTGNALDLTETQAHALVVPPDARRLELFVEVESTGGSVSWSLDDPQGVVRVQRTANQGTLESTETFDPLPGEWRLNVTFDELTGSYDFRLRAKW